MYSEATDVQRLVRGSSARRAPGGARALLSLVLVSLLASCGGSSGDAPDPTWITGDASLKLTYGTSPVTGLDPSVRFVGSIPYGTDPTQVFDAFLPTSSTPTAAIIYVHGGGFVQGSRDDAYGNGAPEIHQIVGAGVAWFGVDYRLLADPGIETDGVRKSLGDARRALQFIRHHARELNIDPKHVAMYGISAGAGTSLWLATHDDMAQGHNDDTIARESTRPIAVSAIATQATYDILRWAPDIFNPEYSVVSNELLLTVSAAVDLLVSFYGLPASVRTDTVALIAMLENAYYAPYRADLDMLALASADDPPAHLYTPLPDLGPLDPNFDVLHHPLHPKTFYETATYQGMSVVAEIPAYGIHTPDTPVDFLLAHVK